MKKVIHIFMLFLLSLCLCGQTTQITTVYMKLIQGIVDECDQYSNSSLMQIIFKQSPYRNVYQKYFHNTISNNALKDFFEEE